MVSDLKLTVLAIIVMFGIGTRKHVKNSAIPETDGGDQTSIHTQAI
jgi:hypothetical protein